ncbi:hypothetical protein OIU79_018788, partial [Salix purpurea]
MTYRMVNTIASRAWRPCGLEQGATDRGVLEAPTPPHQASVQSAQVSTATIPPPDQQKNPNTTIDKPRHHIPKPPDTSTKQNDTTATPNDIPPSRENCPPPDDTIPKPTEPTGQPTATRAGCVTNQAAKAQVTIRPATAAQKAQPKSTYNREDHLSGPSLGPNKEGLDEARSDKREAICTLSKMDSLGSHTSMAASEASSSSTTFPHEEDDNCTTTPPEA